LLQGVMVVKQTYTYVACNLITDSGTKWVSFHG